MRSYHDSCGIARALDIVGERWALLVIRELLLGPKRFTDLRAGLPGVGPDMLSARLRELEAAGLVTRASAPPAASRLYALTDAGAQLEPVLLALGRWGSQLPIAPTAAPLSPDAIGVALLTTYVPPGGSSARELRVRLRLGDRMLLARAGAHALTVTAADGEGADATLITDPPTLAALAFHGRSLTAAERDGRASVDGDRAAAVQFLTRFGLDATPLAAAE